LFAVAASHEAFISAALVWLTELPRQNTAKGPTYSAALAEMRFYG